MARAGSSRLSLQLKQPVLRLHRLTPLPCPFCPDLFYTDSARSAHSARRHKRELKHQGFSLQCKTCKETLRDRPTFRAHVQAHTDLNPLLYFCPGCGNGFTSRANLEVHTKKIHQLVTLYGCDRCEAKYERFVDLKNHKFTHDGLFQCKVCEVRFQDAFTLLQHSVVHQKGLQEEPRAGLEFRPYSCTQCGKRYVRLANMQRHVAFHEAVGASHTGSEPEVLIID